MFKRYKNDSDNFIIKGDIECYVSHVLKMSVEDCINKLYEFNIIVDDDFEGGYIFMPDEPGFSSDRITCNNSGEINYEFLAHNYFEIFVMIIFVTINKFIRQHTNEFKMEVIKQKNIRSIVNINNVHKVELWGFNYDKLLRDYKQRKRLDNRFRAKSARSI